MEITDLSGASDSRRDAAAAVIEAGLVAFNRGVPPGRSAGPVVLAVEDENAVVAGAVGRTAWNWLRLDILWVHQSLRGTGVGTRLLARVEQVARERSCIGVHLDTFGFQAPEFYARHGYQKFGELPDSPDSPHVYLFKRLGDPISRP